MRNSILLLITCLTAIGCGSDVDKMATSEGDAPWPALESFETDGLMAVGYPMEMGAWSEVKKALASDSFATALQGFEQSELPEEYSDKQPQKDATVKAFQEAIEAAKSGSQDDVKTKLQAAMDSIPALRN